MPGGLADGAGLKLIVPRSRNRSRRYQSLRENDYENENENEGLGAPRPIPVIDRTAVRPTLDFNKTR
jgi:hypothetical protein